MLAEQQQEVRQMQAGARRQDRLAEERLRRCEDQITSMAQARQELDHKVCTTLSCTGVEQCSAVCSSLPPEAASQACPTCYPQFCAKPCSVMQCSAVQCSAVQCSAVQCSAVQCSAVQCSAGPQQST